MTAVRDDSQRSVTVHEIVFVTRGAKAVVLCTCGGFEHAVILGGEPAAVAASLHRAAQRHLCAADRGALAS